MTNRDTKGNIFLKMTETILLLGFSTVMILLVTGGKYLLFVIPSSKYFIIFTATVFFIWGMSSLVALVKGKYDGTVGFKSLIISIAFPLCIIGFAVRNNRFSFSSFDVAKFSSTEEPVEKPSEKDGQESSVTFFLGAAADFDFENRVISISEENYLRDIDEIFANPFSYENYSVSVKAFVYINDEFLSPDEFIEARLLMTCCANDVQPYGLVCRTKNRSELEKEEWYEIEGTIVIGEYNGKPEPQIEVSSWKPCEQVEGFIYPL